MTKNPLANSFNEPTARGINIKKCGTTTIINNCNCDAL